MYRLSAIIELDILSRTPLIASFKLNYVHARHRNDETIILDVVHKFYFTRLRVLLLA